jgi:hypothetical protein
MKLSPGYYCGSSSDLLGIFSSPEDRRGATLMVGRTRRPGRGQREIRRRSGSSSNPTTRSRRSGSAHQLPFVLPLYSSAVVVQWCASAVGEARS